MSNAKSTQTKVINLVREYNRIQENKAKYFQEREAEKKAAQENVPTHEEIFAEYEEYSEEAA